MDVRQCLFEKQDLAYQAFQKRIIPHEERIIGVRMKDVRMIAKQCFKEEGLAYLERELDYHEEKLIRGMVLARIEDMEQMLLWIPSQLSLIDNWALCDQFVSELKITKSDPERMLHFMRLYYQSKETYALRFLCVMFLTYYVQDTYRKEAFACFEAMHSEDYYVKMALAWAVSIYYFDDRKETIRFLEKHSLDAWTHNKAIQKICESLRIEAEEKAYVQALKRPCA